MTSVFSVIGVFCFGISAYIYLYDEFKIKFGKIPAILVVLYVPVVYILLSFLLYS